MCVLWVFSSAGRNIIDEPQLLLPKFGNTWDKTNEVSHVVVEIGLHNMKYTILIINKCDEMNTYMYVHEIVKLETSIDKQQIRIMQWNEQLSNTWIT